MKPEKNSGESTLKGYDPILLYASEIEAMTGAVFDAFTDQMDVRMESDLRWIAANPNHPDTPDVAAEWIRLQMKLERTDPAGRLSRAIKSGNVRNDEKTKGVPLAVAAFIRQHRQWPEREEIKVPGVSKRTRDLAFEEIKNKFGVAIDGRGRWVDSQ